MTSTDGKLELRVTFLMSLMSTASLRESGACGKKTGFIGLISDVNFSLWIKLQSDFYGACCEDVKRSVGGCGGTQQGY